MLRQVKTTGISQSFFSSWFLTVSECIKIVGWQCYIACPIQFSFPHWIITGFILVSTHYKISTARNPVIWQIESDEKSQIKHETGTVTEDLVKLKNVSEKSKTFGSLRSLIIFNCMVFQIASCSACFFFCKRCQNYRRKMRVMWLYIWYKFYVTLITRDFECWCYEKSKK